MRPYNRLSGLAPKERQESGSGRPALGQSFLYLCVSVVKIFLVSLWLGPDPAEASVTGLRTLGQVLDLHPGKIVGSEPG